MYICKEHVIVNNMKSVNNHIVCKGGAALLSVLLPFLTTSFTLQPTPTKRSPTPQTVRLFESKSDSIPYRIPAMTTCRNGDIIVAADYRYCGRDIGFGAIDLHYRISKDGGHIWSTSLVMADGTGDETAKPTPWNYAFGDCALVADANSDEVLAICVGGKVPYFYGRRDKPTPVIAFRSYDNGKTWDQGQDITEAIYSLFDRRKKGPVNALFMASGKIHQSRYVKVERYNRIYSALATRSGNYVVFSDDFGRSWKVLGDINMSPVADGDEPKCEELPDGSVIISSRTKGRFFNIFTFTDLQQAKGSWQQRMRATDMDDIDNSCNGDILLLPVVRTADKQSVWIALQSVPFGPKRNNVGFFFHELTDTHEDVKAFAEHWMRGLQVSYGASAYSTMSLLKSGLIAFAWEEGPTEYNIDFRTFCLKDITLGNYSLDKKFKRKLTALQEKQGL